MECLCKILKSLHNNNQYKRRLFCIMKISSQWVKFKITWITILRPMQLVIYRRVCHLWVQPAWIVLILRPLWSQNKGMEQFLMVGLRSCQISLQQIEQTKRATILNFSNMLKTSKKDLKICYKKKIRPLINWDKQ